jgi:hypothetical protein
VQAPAALLDLFQEAPPAPFDTSPYLTTVLDDRPPLPAESPAGADAVARAPAPPVEDDTLFALPEWALATAPGESAAVEEPGLLPTPAPVPAAVLVAPAAPAPVAEEGSLAGPDAADEHVHEDVRDQAITAARERLARLAVLRAEDDRRQVEEQARALRRQRVMVGASLLLLGGVAAALFWFLSSWVW